VNGLPNGATFVNKTFSWVPDFSQAGIYPVTFVVDDGMLKSQENISVTVINYSLGRFKRSSK